MKVNLENIPKYFYWATAILTFAFFVYGFYPGYMSFDSAQQYKQVISGDWNTISPIIMVMLWNVTELYIEGPGGLFLLFFFLFWLGLVLFTYNLNLNDWLKSIILIIIIFWPFNLMILPHIWKDVGLISFMMLSIGLIQLHHNSKLKYPLFLAITMLIMASLFRFESIIYIGILDVYTVLLIIRTYQFNHISLLRKTIFYIFPLLATIAISNSLVKLTDTKKVVLWQTVALWDLSRVSVKIDKILLPDFTIGKNMTPEDLSNATVPWTNTYLFFKTKAGMNSGLTTPYSASENKILFKTWLSMILNYPMEYFTHRLEVFNDLFRVNESKNKPIDLYFTHKIIEFNEKFKLNKTSLNIKIMAGIKSSLNTLIFKGWVYLLIQLLALSYILMQKKNTNNEFMFFLSLSAIASSFVLTFVSPSAEQRYLIWLINSTLLIMALQLQKKL